MKQERTGGLAVELALLLVVIALAIPGVIYLLMQLAIASGSQDIPSLRWVGRQSPVYALIAPFTTLGSGFPLAVLWFGGRRLWFKIIATLLVLLGGIGLVVFPTDETLGGGPRLKGDALAARGQATLDLVPNQVLAFPSDLLILASFFSSVRRSPQAENAEQSSLPLVDARARCRPGSFRKHRAAVIVSSQGRLPGLPEE